VRAGRRPVRLLALPANEGLAELWERGAAAVNAMLQHATTSDRLQGKRLRKRFGQRVFLGTVVRKTKYESLDAEHDDDWFLVRAPAALVAARPGRARPLPPPSPSLLFSVHHG
jgi:hypothetical protein